MLPACIRTAGPPVLSEPPRGDRNRMSCLQTSNCEARVRVYSLVSQRRRPHFAMRSSERAKTAQLCRTHTAQIRGRAALPPSKKLRFSKSNLISEEHNQRESPPVQESAFRPLLASQVVSAHPLKINMNWRGSVLAKILRKC